MTKGNNFIWKVIQCVCWVIFVGFCVQTGALLFNYIYSLFKPIVAHNVYLGLDLSSLYQRSQGMYALVFVLAIGITAYKAYLFFVTVQIFKKLDLVKPFSQEVYAIIAKITSLTFFIGIISIVAQKVIVQLTKRTHGVGPIERFWDDGGGYLLMSAILFVIVMIFKKGIELQNENDLTV